MKTVALISSLTFVVIFGTILVTSGMLGQTVRTQQQLAALQARPDRGGKDDRIYTPIAEERDRVQRQRELLGAARLQREVEEKRIDQVQQKLAAMIDTLAALQKRYDVTRDREAARLAKVYGAMKPAKAAPILSTLDLETVLQVMRGLKARQAARILSAMDPRLAAEISRRLSDPEGSS